MNNSKLELQPESLRWVCDPKRYSFETTDDIEPLQTLIGQDRAINAINFGLSMEKKGYNIFVTGITGTGKASAIKSHLEKAASWRQSDSSIAQDWCYIHNFTDTDKPKAIRIPQGIARVFERSMAALLTDLRINTEKAFSSSEYQNQKKKLSEDGQSRKRQIFAALEEAANLQGFSVQPSPPGLMLVPLINGKPASQQEYTGLSKTVRAKLESKQRDLTKRVSEAINLSQKTDDEVTVSLKVLDKEILKFAINPLFEALDAEFKDCSQIVDYLGELKQYSLERGVIFREKDNQQTSPQNLAALGLARDRDPFLPFSVNVLVDNSSTTGPPIVIEPHPTYDNLFGKIERRPVMGAYTTDHMMLKSGAIHQANGGYLVVEAKGLVTNQGSWDGLKRAIKNNEARLEDPAIQLGIPSPQGLKPDPIPIDLKVVVIGDQVIHRLLSMNDEDFWELFKVKADFDNQIDNTEENLDAYAAFISKCCQTENILPFDPSGVARVTEYGARLASDKRKLSTRFGLIQEVCIEASYWARQEQSSNVTNKYVKKAIEEKIYRSNLVDERMRTLITDGTIMIDVEGEVTGQVNGLAVYNLGNISFGKPSRITARTYLGKDGVINIEREAKLSGKTHDKGVLILTGYLGSKYATENPLSINASLAFEQNYEGIDGDSASSTELYAVLSSLSGLPIKQGIAVTGSVNQRGEIQPIGGVNQKIEGFYDVCKVAGLSGCQGVLIPKQNVKNLMLREDIAQASRDGMFHIYAVASIDEGIELLTGVESGYIQKDGKFPKGTVNHLVQEALEKQARSMQSFSIGPASRA